MTTVQETGGARHRLHDPLSSQFAAEQSAAGIAAVKDAVVWLLNEYGPMDGNRINSKYAMRSLIHGLPPVAYDSPRKRCGELVVDGVLVVLNPDDPRGTPHIYDIKGQIA